MFSGFLEALPSSSCLWVLRLCVTKGIDLINLHCCCLISKHGHTCPSVSQRLNLGSWLQTNFRSWKSLYLSSSIHAKSPRVNHNRTLAQSQTQAFKVQRAGRRGPAWQGRLFCESCSGSKHQVSPLTKHAYPPPAIWGAPLSRKKEGTTFHFRPVERNPHRNDYSRSQSPNSD